MANYKLILSYDGTRYRGWQNQQNTSSTIQYKLESVLKDILHEPVSLTASGRTDAGVHARRQIANFHCAHSLEIPKVLSQLRHQLPHDIGVYQLESVEESFHARYSCTGKTYRYFIWNSQEPCIFQRRYRTILPDTLDIDAMREASSLFLGTHDFSAYTSSRNKKHSNIRTIRSITLETDMPELMIEFTADGFLYNMVRILTGSLIEVGMKKRNAEDLRLALQSGIRADSGFTAPPQGLFLWDVSY